MFIHRHTCAYVRYDGFVHTPSIFHISCLQVFVKQVTSFSGTPKCPGCIAAWSSVFSAPVKHLKVWLLKLSCDVHERRTLRRIRMPAYCMIHKPVITCFSYNTAQHILHKSLMIIIQWQAYWLHRWTQRIEECTIVTDMQTHLLKGSLLHVPKTCWKLA